MGKNFFIGAFPTLYASIQIKAHTTTKKKQQKGKKYLEMAATTTNNWYEKVE